MPKIGINIATGSLQKNEIVVGIDLGTTNSLVAIVHPDTKKPLALKEQDNSSIVPSIVHFDSFGNALVGDAAKEKLESSPERTIFSAKRLMGKSYADIAQHLNFFSYKIYEDPARKDSLLKIQVDDKFYSPVELSSLILAELKKRAEHILKTPVTKAVVTVPAYFNDAQRQATRDAGKLAGLDVLRIVNEPTAASLAYGIGLEKDAEKLVAVYDLGGGTFDISILRIVDGVFDVLSTNGDTYLGGDDFDKVIVDYWIDSLRLDRELLAENKAILQQFRLLAEMAKRHLSENQIFETPQYIPYILPDLRKQTFEELIKPFVDKTIQCCEKAVKDAKVSLEEIDEIIMVGGSTRVPLVQERVTSYFGKKLNNSLNPDEVVALGAAIQADILSGNNKDLLLLDITPLSLGIETMGGLMDVIIPRNAKIPTNASRQYTTYADGQGSMRISIFQGERDMVADNRKLGEFNLKGIPPMPAGLAKVEIKFLIDADGILRVSAKELRSGVQQSVEVKPQYGLTDEEVEQILLDSILHAQDDIAKRALVEAVTEAEQLLKDTEKFITRNRQHLSDTEFMDTAAAMQTLQLSLTLGDKDLVRAKTEVLNEITKPFAEKVMDEAISEALKGKHILGN